MFNHIADALHYINKTMVNHMDPGVELYVEFVGPNNYRAGLRDPGAADPHIQVECAGGIDPALVQLANAIREDSEIGAY